MGEGTCAACADCNGRAKRAGGGKAGMGTKCPDCGAGVIDDDRL